MSEPDHVPTSSTTSGLSFTQGFLLGQLSVVILIGAFIKFFIFGEPPSRGSSSSSARQRELSTLSPSHKRTLSFTATNTSRSPDRRSKQTSSTSSHIIRPPPILQPATILAKTFYNVHAHQPESLDWFNVLIAQTIAQLRTDAHADDAILTSLTTILNGEQKPDFLEKIAVTEINLGEDFPIFSNCRVHPVEDEDGATGGRLQARMDVDLSDFITLGIETTMVLNYPRPRTAVLPVALSVSVVRFSGTLSISFIPATNLPFEGKENTLPTSPGGTSKRTPTTLAFSFLPNYTLSLSTRSLLGARSRLQDVPKIAQLVESRLRNWFEERCVSPRMQQIIVPNIWPRMKNVVESGEAPQSPGRERREDDVFGAPLSSASALRDAMEDRAGVRWRGATGMGFGLRGRQDLEERRAGDRRSYELNMPGGLPGMLVS